MIQAQLSALGIPQIALVHGISVAGGIHSTVTQQPQLQQLFRCLRSSNGRRKCHSP